MSASVKKLAAKYYPKNWNVERLVALVEAEKLDQEEYNEVTGFVYPATEAVETEIQEETSEGEEIVEGDQNGSSEGQEEAQESK